VGETIEVMKPDGRNLDVVVKEIYNEEGVPQESAPHSRQILFIDLGEVMEPYDIIRRSEMS
jgi:putative protease